VVSATGAISAPSTLAPGTYTASGTDSDTAGDTGFWRFTLTVNPAPPPPSIVCLDYGYVPAPLGYVVIGVFADQECGPVYSNLGYNAAAIALPHDGLVICQLGGDEVRHPPGYVATHVYAEGGPTSVGNCGMVSLSLGYNATEIEQPSDGLTMCVLGADVTLPSGYVATAVATDTGGAGPDSLLFGGCGPVDEGVGYNEITIAQPHDGLTMCALAGELRVPAGYVVTAFGSTRSCGPLFSDDVNAATLMTAPSTPALDTSSTTANGPGTTSAMVTCPPPASGCTGMLGLQGPVGSGASDAAANAARSALPKLAEASFRIPAGSAVVTLRLNARARKLLARVQTLRARAILTIRPDGGASRTIVRTVTIRAGGLDSAQIKARLRGQITPRGKAAKIEAVLSNHGCTLQFTSPTAGRVVIDWYQLSSASGGGQTRTLIASGARSFRRAGVADVRIGLTASGKRVLNGRRRLPLTANVELVPAGEYPVTLTKTFTLTR
jgi:hypothetical protein